MAACSFSPIMPADAFLFLMLGVVSGHAVIFNVSAFRHGPAALLVPIDYFGIIAATTISFFAYLEVPTASMVVGSGLVAVTGLAQLRIARRDLPSEIALWSRMVELHCSKGLKDRSLGKHRKSHPPTSE